MDDENKFEAVRKIDLLFMFLYKLSNSEVELVLTEFYKQYTKEDLSWFKCELQKLFRNYTVSPTISTATFSPL